MFTGLPSSLDQLASENVINFDAESYIKGTPARYIGSPHNTSIPFEQPLPAFPQGTPHIRRQPDQDVFEHGSAPKRDWKGLLFAVIVSGLIALGGVKAAKVINKVRTPKPPKPPKQPGFIKKTWAKIPKWGKYTIGIAGGLIAATGIYKWYQSRKAKKAAMH